MTERDQAPIDASRAPVIYKTASRVNWTQLREYAEIGLLVIATFADVAIEKAQKEALANVRAEFGRDNSPLNDRFDEVDPNNYNILFHLAAAAYLEQLVPEDISSVPTPKPDFAWHEKIRARAEQMGRRITKFAGITTRKGASLATYIEAHLTAEKEHVDINPLLPLAEELGLQAFRNTHPDLSTPAQS